MTGSRAALIVLTLLVLASIGLNVFTYTRLRKAENHAIDLERRIDSVAGDVEQLQPAATTEASLSPEAVQAASAEQLERLRVETDSRFSTVCQQSSGQICP